MFLNLFFKKNNHTKDHPTKDKKNRYADQKAIYADRWDPAIQKPVIRSSICTGEKVAGFKNLTTGKFEDIMLIRDDHDLDEFLSLYGVDAGTITKEW